MRVVVRWFALLAVAAWVTTFAVAGAPELWGGLRGGPHGVGFRLIEERDAARAIRVSGATPEVRPRPVRVYLWYPARAADDARPMTFGRYATLADQDVWPDSVLRGARDRTAFDRRPLARSLGADGLAALLEYRMGAVEDAPAAAGRFPLVVVGQGLYYESPVTHVVLCEFLASHGFVVATAPLVGTHSPLVSLDVRDLETQVRDLEFVLAHARSLPFVDGEKLGLVGFDMGGMACLILAMRNPDVDALATMDAGILSGHPSGIPAASPDHDPARLRTPWLHVTQSRFGTRQPGDENDFLFDTAVFSDRYLVLVDDVGHVDFTSYAMIEDRQPVAGYWGPSGDGARAMHEAVCDQVLRFLDAYLANDAERRGSLMRSPEASDREAGFTVEHRAASAPEPVYPDLLNDLLAGRIDAAVASAEHVWKSHPDHPLLQPEVLGRLGAHLLASWQLAAEGMAVLRLNVELHPKSPRAWASLGEGQMRAGNPEAAAENVRRALDLEPDNAELRRFLEWIEGQQEPSQ